MSRTRLLRGSVGAIAVVAGFYMSCAKGSAVFENGDEDDDGSNGEGGDGGAPGNGTATTGANEIVTSSATGMTSASTSGPSGSTATSGSTASSASASSSVSSANASSASSSVASVASSSSGGIVCGNFACEAGEDACTCPSDCSDIVDQCSTCECGGPDSNQLCYCDPACVGYGDCCSNYSAVCGGVDPALSCDPSECGGDGGDCYCDDACVGIGDCCADACSVCGAC